ncbi:MAG TPA: hypothetical protein VJ964_10170 [Balneolaceae bacterium]|nr:hypothetical protein [Balneolaceae bacterium]
MKYNKIRNLVFVFALSLLAFACSDSSTSSNADQAKVNGRVENNQSKKAKSAGTNQQMASVEGATVTAARVNSDGSLQMIDNAKATTDAQGKFTLKINADAAANAAGKIVVIAKSNSQKWKGVVVGKLKSNSSVDMKPLTVESSGEANVFQQIVADGGTDMVTKADIETYVDQNAAADIKSNSDAAAQFASALEAEAQTRAQFFANQSADITDQQMTDIKNAKAQALANLNASLYASSSSSAKADAYQAFFKAMANAYSKADVSANVYAKAKESASHMLIKNMTMLSSSARSQVRADAAYVVAIAIDNAVQARMKAANASDSSVQAAAEAGTKLRADLSAKTTATKDEIDSVFETYNNAIVDVMKTEFSANAQTMVDINSQINSTGGIKAQLQSSIESSASADVLVQAYVTFISNVKSIVDNTFSSATNAQAQLVTNVMVLINLGN